MAWQFVQAVVEYTGCSMELHNGGSMVGKGLMTGGHRTNGNYRGPLRPGSMVLEDRLSTRLEVRVRMKGDSAQTAE